LARITQKVYCTYFHCGPLRNRRKKEKKKKRKKKEKRKEKPVYLPFLIDRGNHVRLYSKFNLNTPPKDIDHLIFA